MAFTKEQFHAIAFNFSTSFMDCVEQKQITRNGVHHISYQFDLDATDCGGRTSHVVLYFGTDADGVQNGTIVAEIDDRETITLDAKKTYLNYSGIYRLIYAAVFCTIS